MAKIVTGLDIQRGKTSINKVGNVDLDFQPWHMIPASEKTQEWKEYIADFYESLGWKQVKKNYKAIIKNRKLVAGELDMEDYIVNPDENEFAGMIGIIEENVDPLKQYFPVIPNVIDTLTGEAMQKDNRIIVKAVDSFSTDERLAYKEELFRETLVRQNMSDKQAALLKMGFIPDEGNQEMMQQYQQEMETAKQLAEIEAKFKKFRTKAEDWGQNKLEINRRKFGLDFLEVEGFRESLTNSAVAYEIDMGESDFKFKLLDNAMCFKHVSPNLKYYSEGDFFGYFEYVTVGDIIDQLGSRSDVTAEVIDKLKDVLTLHSAGVLLPDYMTTSQGTYYNTNKKWPEGYQNIPMVQALTEHNVKEHLGIPTGQPAAYILGQQKKAELGDPRLFRKMILYVRSQRKIGWLTKVNRAGQVEFSGWIDETFEETVEPVYDHSITKAKTSKNLLYGEHVDWQWANEWRRFIKITNNIDHSFWKNADKEFKPIHLDGEPCKFQFKGQDNPFEIYPAFEGCEFRTKGIKPISLVSRMKPWQIIANIAGNKIPVLMANDPGVVLAMDRQTIPRDFMDNQSGGDPVADYMQNIIDNRIIDRSVSKEQLEGGSGNNLIAPTAVNLSRVQEMVGYLNLYRMAKEEALEAVGITRARLGQQKPYETATSIQAGAQFSETQTLGYFNQFYQEFMPRVYQRILEATQFYSVQEDTANIDFMNSKEDNVFLEVAGKELLRHLHTYCTSSPRIKKIEEQLKQLLLADNTMGMGILEKAEGFIAETTTDYMDKLRKWNADKLQRESEQFEAEQETRRNQAEMALQNGREQREAEERKAQLDRESRENVAWIQSLGRTQTPGVADSLDKAGQTLEMDLRQQELSNKMTTEQSKQQLEQQKHVDDTLLRQQETQAKLKMKEIDKEIAKENKTKAELGRKK